MHDPVKFLHDMLAAGLAAADPLITLPSFLPAQPSGRVIVLGAGKASAAMARAVELAWPDADLSGLIVTRYGYGVKTERIEIVEAAHPVPDAAGAAACGRIMEMARNAGKDDLVLALISGGGSALLTAPAPCLTLEDKREINRALLRSGAPIHEMNCVRKHLSAVKGGRLALLAAPAKVLTLVVSDIPGDDACMVASGPTLPDTSTQAQARAVLEKYNIEIGDSVLQWLSDPANETPKPGHAAFAGHESIIVARANDMLMAAAEFAAAQGVEPVIIGDAIEGEAHVVGEEHVQKAFHYLRKSPLVLLSGGETTVTLRGTGKGGRNSEYLLGAVIAAIGHRQIYGIACDTDGIDGSEDNAGAYFTPATLGAAKKLGMDAAEFIRNNDAYSFFKATGNLVVTGPTYTNVNDFRAILVL